MIVSLGRIRLFVMKEEQQASKPNTLYRKVLIADELDRDIKSETTSLRLLGCSSSEWDLVLLQLGQFHNLTDLTIDSVIPDDEDIDFSYLHNLKSLCIRNDTIKHVDLDRDRLKSLSKLNKLSKLTISKRDVIQRLTTSASMGSNSC